MAENLYTPSDAAVTDILLQINETLLGFAASPWFSKLAWSEVGSSTIWGVTAADGAIIYASRDWDEYAAPVSIDGADELTLSLHRPDEISENWLTDGIGYGLWPGRSEGSLCHDGYAPEQYENEVLRWAGVDSPVALVQYIANAIHHGQVRGVMHRTWAEYSAPTPDGYRCKLFADKEAVIMPENSSTDCTLDIVTDQPPEEGTGAGRLYALGKIAQIGQSAWSLQELEVSSEFVGTESHDAAVLTTELGRASNIGAETLRHCAASMHVLYAQALAARNQASVKV